MTSLPNGVYELVTIVIKASEYTNYTKFAIKASIKGRHLISSAGLYLCLAGHVQVTYANSKLINWPLRAGCGPEAVCCNSWLKCLNRELKDKKKD